MATTKPWLKGKSFSRSMKRTIDRETLLDLLGIVIYEADRSALLENAGFTDKASSVDCLFHYVLDALGVPAESEAFSREPFEQIFYNDFWLEKRHKSLDDVLSGLESLKNETVERFAKAGATRVSFSIVPTDKSVK